MLHRLSVRRFLLCLALCGLFTILFLLYRNRELLPSIRDIIEHEPSDVQGFEEQKLRQRETKWQQYHNIDQTQRAVHMHDSSSRGSLLTKSSINWDVEVVPKLWFFKDGTKYPEILSRSRPLFPDEDSGDRITYQLMHIPYGYDGQDLYIQVCVNDTHIAGEDSRLMLRVDVFARPIIAPISIPVARTHAERLAESLEVHTPSPMSSEPTQDPPSPATSYESVPDPPTSSAEP